ncbi:MAG: BamA/TamA family outer membrane protein [Bacteroidaceae bacterium]
MRSRYMLLTAIGIFSVAISATAQQDSIPQERGLRRWWNSLVHGNVDRTHEQRIDMTFILAPCYTREGGVGMGGVATALYRLDRTDSIMQPSDFSLSGSATLKGIYGITAKGNNHFRGNRSRLTYSLQFMHKTLDFWGISYDACSVNPISEYTKQQLKWQSDYVYKFTSGFHVGAAFNINYTSLSKASDRSYLEGQKNSYFFAGIGMSLQYDTRDFILNPRHGVYFMVREVVYPSFMSSCDKTLTNTTLQFDIYQPVWQGGTLAFDLYGSLNRDCTPWTMREELGSGTSRMRGYYAGRYIDCSQIAAQVELRQHIYSRLGCVAWVGGGNVFPSFSQLKLGNTLPNYGLGLRIEFKHDVNVRIDYGFGKDTGGFVFQFAEAF